MALKFYHPLSQQDAWVKYDSMWIINIMSVCMFLANLPCIFFVSLTERCNSVNILNTFDEDNSTRHKSAFYYGKARPLQFRKFMTSFDMYLVNMVNVIIWQVKDTTTFMALSTWISQRMKSRSRTHTTAIHDMTRLAVVWSDGSAGGVTSAWIVVVLLSFSRRNALQWPGSGTILTLEALNDIII